MDFETLVKKAKNGDKNSLEEILISLKPYIIKQCNCIFLNGYELDDLIQLGYLSVLKSINKYDCNKNTSFLSYAINAIKNNFSYLIRQKSRTNFEKSLNIENGDGFEFIDILCDNSNLEDNFILREDYKLLEQAMNKLTASEIDFLHCIYFDGMKIKDYTELKGLNYKQTLKKKKKILLKLKLALEASK